MSQQDFYEIMYYHHAKLGLKDGFKRLGVKSRMASDIWEYERTGFITPFSPRFYTKQIVALRIYDHETKQPLDKWDVILKDSLSNRADVQRYTVSEAEAKKEIDQFNQQISDDLEQKRQKADEFAQNKRDRYARKTL